MCILDMALLLSSTSKVARIHMSIAGMVASRGIHMVHSAHNESQRKKTPVPYCAYRLVAASGRASIRLDLEVETVLGI